MWQRWNNSTHIFEKSSDNGAIWTPLGLSADIITEGALAKARQHAQTVYQDQVPIFTGAIRAYSRAVAEGEWAAFTPTFLGAGGGTPPALGNGTIVGRFTRKGRTGFFYIVLTYGSTSTGGTELWSFGGLPEALISGGAYDVNVTAVNSGVRLYTGKGLIGTTIVSLCWMHDAVVGAENWLANGFPFAMGTADTLTIGGWYEF